MKSASLIFALCFLASDLASTPVLAATATASFSVTATVSASCQVSAPATAFGAYTAVKANVASPASVNCTSPTPYNVSLSAELVPSATITTRKTAGAYAMPGTAHGSSHPYASYGQTAGGAQSVAPGAFADSVTVTITY
jgi:spore coat protein U-like protein